jgi:hypothetical protein
VISERNNKGVPIMVQVAEPYCCHCKLNIPYGIVTLGQSCGEKKGIMAPGYYCCFCSYKKIAAQISKNSIRYNVPVIRILTIS